MQLSQFSGMVLLESNMQAIHMDERDQRYLMTWMWKNRPEVVRDICCEECPEHIGEMERKAYVLNECERGHKA